MPYQRIKSALHTVVRDATEMTTAKYKHFTDRYRNETTRVKLVAVAKNEAAYLPEWIAHHLYFGFDAIEIHINRTTDNTYDVLSELAKHPRVSLKNADDLFDKYPGNPQVGVYKKALSKVAREGFTHICFLDIDEFWLPRNLKDSIHDCIRSLNYPDVVSFEWCNKFEPENTFGPAIEPEISLIRAPQVKSIIHSRAPAFRVNPHAIVNPYLRYKLADGSTPQQTTPGYSRVTEDELQKPVKPYFILHRYYRSEMEYIAMLGKGRPNFPQQGVTQVKSNRRGYADASLVQALAFDTTAFKQYRAAVTGMIDKYVSQTELTVARQYIRQTYQKVLAIIEQSPATEARVLSKVLRNVSDPAALSAYQQYLNKQNSK